MDLSKDDLLLIEHVLTREAWRSTPERDLLHRVRLELFDVHGEYMHDRAPRGQDVAGFEVVPPVPKGKEWPELKSSN